MMVLTMETLIKGSAPLGTTGMPLIQVNIKRRLRGLKRGNGQQLSDNTVSLVLLLLLAGALVWVAVLYLRHWQEKVRRRKTARSSTVAAKNSPGPARYALREGDLPPAKVVPGATLEELKENTPVLLFERTPGGLVEEGQVVREKGECLQLSLGHRLELQGTPLYLARQHHQNQLLLYPMLPRDLAPAPGYLPLRLDRDQPVLRLQSAGLIPTELPGVLLESCAEETTREQEIEPLMHSITVSGLGMDRLWVRDMEEPKEDRPLTLRCALPGEPEALELQVSPRRRRLDRQGEGVAEFRILSRTPKNQALLLRHLGNYLSAALQETGTLQAGVLKDQGREPETASTTGSHVAHVRHQQPLP